MTKLVPTPCRIMTCTFTGRVKDSAEGEHFRSGRLENFDRGEFGYYDLLHQALNATAGDGFPVTGRLQPRLQVSISQIPHGTGKPTSEGLINIERQRGGTDQAARFAIELFQSGSQAGESQALPYSSSA